MSIIDEINDLLARWDNNIPIGLEPKVLSDLPDDVQLELATHSDYRIRVICSYNNYLCNSAQLAIASNIDYRMVFERENLAAWCGPDAQVILAKDPEIRVRLRLASNESLSQDAQNILSSDEHSVLVELVKNPFISTITQLLLSKVSSSVIAHYLAVTEYTDDSDEAKEVAKTTMKRLGETVFFPLSEAYINEMKARNVDTK